LINYKCCEQPLTNFLQKADYSIQTDVMQGFKKSPDSVPLRLLPDFTLALNIFFALLDGPVNHAQLHSNPQLRQRLR